MHGSFNYTKQYLFFNNREIKRLIKNNLSIEE